MDKKPMKTNEIKEVLMKSLYEKSRGLFVTNYTGCGLPECDVLRITESNIVYEYEIKNSRSDFKADFKKIHKHEVLQGKHKDNPQYNKYKDFYYTEEYLNENWGSVGRANHFYYVCVEGLIKENEIPEYVGLIYVKEDKIEVVRKAPKLHSFKANEKLVRSVASLLSSRFVFGGCSYMTYKNRQNQ